MEEFEEVFKPNELHQRLQKSLGINSQLSEMLKDKDGTTKSILGISMASALSKKIQQHQRRFEYFNLAEIKTLANRLGSLSELVLPQSTIGILESLNRHQEDLQVGTSTLANVLRRQSIDLAQINNLSSALSSISVQFAEIALKQRNLDFINDFEEVNEQSIVFSESLTEEVTEEHKRQFEILIALFVAFFNKYKQKGVFAHATLQIFLNIYTIYNIFSPQPELATKEDVRQLNIKQDTLTQYILLLNKQLREAKEYRITNRDCELKLKPKSKTLTLCKLPKDFELNVLQVHHKWVLVSFIDLDDNLPQTGWILKKFLEKP